jgi:aminopeptidase-like protein
MTAKDRSRFETQFQLSSGKSNTRKLKEIRERLVVACLCDEEGVLLLQDSDVDAVGAQPAAVVERIVDAAQKVCGMSNNDVEDLAKNSEETLADS